MKLTRILLCSFALTSVTSLSTALAAEENAAPAEAPKAPAEGEKGERKGPRGRMMMSPEEQVASIDKSVGGLTDDQKKQVLAIITKTREQMQALAPEDRREKGRELFQEQNKQIRALLTADQQKKFDEMPRPGRGPGGPRPKQDQ